MLGRRRARRQGHRLQGRGEGASRRERGVLLDRVAVEGGARGGQQESNERSAHEDGRRHAVRRQAPDLRRLRNPSRHRRVTRMAKIVPCLWYTDNAEEAAAFYVSLMPDSRIDNVTTLPADTPSGPEGSVQVVAFTLAGQPFMAMKAGPLDPFNHAISFMVNCADQAEIDRLWAALSQGGTVEQCGWLKDRYGLSWQIVPTVLGE